MDLELATPLNSYEKVATCWIRAIVYLCGTLKANGCLMVPEVGQIWDEK